MDYKELKPGRELDALIAEKVMGLEPFEFPTFKIENQFDNAIAAIIADEYEKRREPLPYSTKIEDAWQVVEKIKTHKNFVDFEIRSPNIETMEGFDVRFCLGRGNKRAYADTAPHAICLAALKAIES